MNCCSSTSEIKVHNDLTGFCWLKRYSIEPKVNYIQKWKEGKDHIANRYKVIRLAQYK